MPKLTKRYIESLKPHSEKLQVFWDSEIKGFGASILPSGRCTYVIQYRNAERVKKRLKLGVHGQISTEEARDLAKKHFATIAHGIDPVSEKKKTCELPAFVELVKDYRERHAQRKRPKSLKEDERLLESFVIPSLRNRKVAHISRRDVESLHMRHKNTPYQANRILALLSKMFSLAVSWGWRADNPAQGIPRYQEQKRDNWLNKEELQQLWKVLDQHSNHITAYVFKFLLLTGARKGEALNATWNQFDLDNKVWTKPSHMTKQKKQEHLPLSDQACEVLIAVKKFSDGESPFVFPGLIPGQPLKEVKTFWKSALKKANLKDVRIHDLRHTHASHLVSSGLSLSIVGKLLGHTQASTTQRYAHLADAPLRQAAELFSSKLMESPKKEASHD